MRSWADAASAGPVRRAGQALIGAAILGWHLLLFMHFQSRIASPPSAQRLTLWLLPDAVSRPPVTTPAPRPRLAEPKTGDRVVLPRTASPTRAALPPFMPPPLPLSLAVAPRTPTETTDTLAGSDVVGHALRDVGKIDQALRREFPSFPAPLPVSIQSRLEKAFALAARHNGLSPDMQERQLADGRRITRVTTSSGSYCVTQKGAGASDGIDHLANGNQLQMTSCGHLFD